MTLVEISPDYSAAPQIDVEDVARIRDRGFWAIMCNRPDGESPDQTPVAEIRAEAERLGLGFAHVPVVSGAITHNDVARFAEALDTLPGPVLAYCRSGARCQNLWLLAGR